MSKVLHGLHELAVTAWIDLVNDTPLQRTMQREREMTRTGEKSETPQSKHLSLRPW